VTVSGKTVTVRQHTRYTDHGPDMDERRPAAEDAAPAPRPAALPPATQRDDAEEWWDDSEPRPEPWMDTGEDEPERSYPCAMCGGSGTSRFWHGATCNRCSGSGSDPYAMR
jgi:hypothetical protein